MSSPGHPRCTSLGWSTLPHHQLLLHSLHQAKQDLFLRFSAAPLPPLTASLKEGASSVFPKCPALSLAVLFTLLGDGLATVGLEAYWACFWLTVQTQEPHTGTWHLLKKWSHSSCPALCNPMDCSLPGSSVHGILQARILEWVPVSRGSFQPRDQTQISHIAGRIFTFWATREALY